MNNSELPLYLKISPIYNKILQLGIAVLCIVVLLNILILSQNKQNSVIAKQFNYLSEVQLEQAVTAFKVLLNNEDSISSKNKTNIEKYIHQLAQSNTVNDVHFYDESGLLQVSSSDSINMKTLYGLTPIELDTKDQSQLYGTFVEEIRTDKLLGYLRITINKEITNSRLTKANFDVHETMRLLVLFSLIIGFLLTRGFSRFSRQGFRMNKSKVD